MSFQIVEYHISQSGKVLTCTDESGKIIINKYDNKVSKIVFSLDGTVPGRLYFALLNPTTKEYSMTPILNNEVVIGTNVSIYPGKWSSILIGVQDDYEIQNNDIDQSKLTYVSNEFKRIVVRDNFLDEYNIESCANPAIDELLDMLVKAQDRLENAAISAEESVKLTTENKEEISEIKGEISDIVSQLNADSTEINELLIESQNLLEEAQNLAKDLIETKDDVKYIQTTFESILERLEKLEADTYQINKALAVKAEKSDVIEIYRIINQTYTDEDIDNLFE